MDRWRGTMIAACMLTGGCFPRETPSISAVDPLDSIPAIQQAAQEKDRKAVPKLVKQLDNTDPAIRFYAIGALRRITGRDFGYRFYDDADERRPAAERWNHWIEQGMP